MSTTDADDGSHPRPPRQTQAERRAISREKILDAAVSCLAERGYAGTTFPEVLRRAGLSNGAMWRHFRSKADLLVAAVLHAEAQLVAPDRDPPAPNRSETARVDAAVEHLWGYAHSPGCQALIELLRASRSDPELRAALIGRDSDAAGLFFDACARSLGPELAGRPMFRHNARMLGLVLYGTALTEGLRSESQENRLLGELKQLARKLFRDPAAEVVESRTARGRDGGRSTARAAAYSTSVTGESAGTRRRSR